MEEYLDLEFHIIGDGNAILKHQNTESVGTPDLSEASLEVLRSLFPDQRRYGMFLFQRLFLAHKEKVQIPNALDIPESSTDSISPLYLFYRERLTIARRQRQRLRLRIHVDQNAAEEIQSLMYELLYDPRERFFLSVSRDVVLSRYESVAVVRELDDKSTNKILILVSAPRDWKENKLPELDRDKTLRMATEALTPLVSLGCTVKSLVGPSTYANLKTEIDQGRYAALHIVAHAVLKDNASRADIVLEDEDGLAAFVNEEAFERIFQGDRYLKLVTLLSCNSAVPTSADPLRGLARRLVQTGIPAVIAMNRAIGVAAALNFAKTLYLNLAKTGYIDASVNTARDRLFTSDVLSFDWIAPILFMRSANGAINLGSKIDGVESQPITSTASPKILNDIAKEIRLKAFIPFVGPEINRDLLPLPTEVALFWKRELALRGTAPLNGRNDLPHVAQMLKNDSAGSTAGPHLGILDIYKRSLFSKVNAKPEIDQTISSILQEFPQLLPQPNQPHSILARLPVSYVLTTCFDPMLELTFKRTGPKKPTSMACVWKSMKKEKYPRGIEATVQNPVIFHIYGDETAIAQEEMVLTEDDHLVFIRNVNSHEWIIPVYVREKIAESMLLFLGFDILDLSFRALFIGLVQNLRSQSKARAAVLQVDPNLVSEGDLQAFKEFLQENCKALQIEFYVATLHEFLLALERRIRA
jgi:hypothetical protein